MLRTTGIGRLHRDARLFLVTIFVAGAALSLYWIDFNLYLSALGLSTATIGIISTVAAAAGAVIAFPVSAASDRFGVVGEAHPALGAVGASATNGTSSLVRQRPRRIRHLPGASMIQAVSFDPKDSSSRSCSFARRRDGRYGAVKQLRARQRVRTPTDTSRWGCGRVGAGTGWSSSRDGQPFPSSTGPGVPFLAA